jgi:hypothetical protein
MKDTSCLIKPHVLKPYVEVEVYFHAFLTSAIDGSQCSALRPARFTSSEGSHIPMARRLGMHQSRSECAGKERALCSSQI